MVCQYFASRAYRVYRAISLCLMLTSTSQNGRAVNCHRGVLYRVFAQVVCTDATCAAVERARAEGRPLWRVSSTVFAHVASDEVLQPLGAFVGAPSAANYPPTPAGLQVQRELEAIQLKAP